MKGFVLICTTAMLVSLTNTSLVQADLMLSAGSEILSGPENGQSQINSAIDAVFPGLTSTEVYKQDVGSSDVGILKDDYMTEFFNTPSDPDDATISLSPGKTPYTGATHLLVKGGNADPSWYLFDIAGWNGVMDIKVTGFTQWGISHVTIYGGPGDPNIVVPEPTSMILAGLGICGLPFLARRRRNAA